MQIDATLPIMMMLPVDQRPGTMPPQTPAPTTTRVQVQDIDHAISELANAVQPFDIALKFSKDPETGTIVIEMISQHTGETLQQIPNEAMLHVSAALGKLQGLIFSRVA
jgi:uncharacterized FlaG/YvyC family protein